MLAVNELYPGFQGEGPTAGRSVFFLRLAGCNLHCSFCDTPFAWKFGDGKFSQSDEVHQHGDDHLAMELDIRMKKIDTLVITGGEPLLQQAALTHMLKVLKNNKIGLEVEVETNGTIIPTPEFDALVTRYNCSPKLASSGNEFNLRIKHDALLAFQATGKACFKFVITSLTALADLCEVSSLVNKDKLTNIWLMPEGTTKEDQINRSPDVLKYAKSRGWNFSPRLHVLAFGPKRGV